ncbi:MAG: hypothetical protein ACYDHD_00205 [Vulcanimicrobiaceae bacterium]
MPASSTVPPPVRAMQGRRQGVYILPADDALIDQIARRLAEAGVVSARGGGVGSLVLRIGLRHLADTLEHAPDVALRLARQVAQKKKR